MPDPLQIVEALFISAMTAGIVVAIFGWPWQAPRRVLARIGGVLGAGAGIATGCWWLGMSLNWPPREDQDRLLLILLPALVVVEIVSALFDRPRWLAWLLRTAIAGCAAPILLHASSYLSDLRGPGTREWTLAQSILILGGLAVVLAAGWAACWRLANRSSSRTILVVLAIACAGAAVTTMLSGYASGGLFGLVLASGLIGAVIASFALIGPPETAGMVGLGVVGLFALLIVGRFFGQLSTANAVLLYAAPLLAWLAEIPFIQRRGKLLHGTAQVALPSILVAAALLMAHRQFVADSARPTGEGNEPAAEDYLNFGK